MVKLTFWLIAVALIVSSSKSSYPECMDDKQKVLQARFSGVVPNQVGFYDSCISKTNMKFMLVDYVNKANNKFEIVWGQCVGKNCSEDEVAEYFQKTVPISEKYVVKARDPHDEKNRHQFGTGAWLYCVFVILLATFVVVATVISQRRKIEERNKKLLVTRSTVKNIKDLQVPGMSSVLTMANPGATVVGAEPSVLQTHEKAKEKKSKPFLELFDAVHNTNSLIYPRIVNASVQVFDLLRVLAMTWVVIGHELAYRLSFSTNFVDAGFLDYSKNSWYFTYNQSGYYAVDIFLFMGGYVSIVSLGKFISSFAPFKPHKVPLIYVFCVFKRYMRIMPAYAFLLVFYYLVVPTMIQGPCSQSLLYNYPCKPGNFAKSFILGWEVDTANNKMCAGWGWYVAMDFRLFMTIPIILIISNFFGKRKNLVGIIICSLCGAFSLGYTYYRGYDKEMYYFNPNDPNDTMNQYYYTDTISRSVIYYLGCLFAYMTMKPEKKKGKHVEGEAKHTEGDTHKNEKHTGDLKEDLVHDDAKKHKKRRSARKMQLIFFIIGFTLFSGVTLILHYYFQWGRDVMHMNRFWTMSFLAFGKFFFIIGLMLVLLITSFRFKGFGEYIGKNRLIQLIANLSFTMYLFHFPILYIRVYSLKSVPTYSGYDLFSAGLTEISFTLVLGYLAAILVEIPAMHIWRVHLEGPLLHLLKKI